MSGLLNQLSEFIKTPEGQGLLSGVFGYAANARRGTPINNLGRGGVAGLLGYANAMDRQDQQAENQWVQKYRQMQMDKAQYDMDRTKSADAEKSRIESVIRSAISPVSGTQAIGLDAAGPTASKAALIGQMPKLDPNALLAQGVPVERVKELIDAQNFGRQKVARTIKGIGPDGREYEYQVDEFGQRIGDGLAQYRAPIAMDTGGRTALLDPYNFQEKFGVNKTMTPGERDASARGWATVSQGERRLAFDQSGGAETYKPQYRDGQWVIPPTGMRPGESRPATPSTAVKDANDAIALIEQAKKIIPNATGSYFGAGMDQVARVFGKSTDGDQAAAQLKALQGALVSKMPKMSGPQSDKDVQLYREMAGEIGDPTIPTSRKLAALKTIEEIQQRYASGQGGASGGWVTPGDQPSSGSGGWGIERVK